MSSAWIGIGVGGLIGATLGGVLSKKLGGHVDLGVTVASAGALALIGGAVMAPKPSTEQASADTTPTTPTTP